MVHHPLNSVLPLLLVPLITIIIRSLKRPGYRAAAAHAASNTNRRTDIASPVNKEPTNMSKPQPKPILNTSLPAQFRQIRIELAREPGHPEGDAAVAYVIVAPLDATDASIQALASASRGMPGCAIAPGQRRPAWSSRSSPRRRLGIPLRCRSQYAGRGRISFRGRTLRGWRICLDQRERTRCTLIASRSVSHL